MEENKAGNFKWEMLNKGEVYQALEWLKCLYIGDENDICALIVPAMELLIDYYASSGDNDIFASSILQRFLDIWKSSTIVGDVKT